MANTEPHRSGYNPNPAGITLEAMRQRLDAVGISIFETRAGARNGPEAGAASGADLRTWHLSYEVGNAKAESVIQSMVDNDQLHPVRL